MNTLNPTLSSNDVKCVKTTPAGADSPTYDVVDRTTGEVYGTVRTSQWRYYTAKDTDGEVVPHGSICDRRSDAIDRLVEQVNFTRNPGVVFQTVGGEDGSPIHNYFHTTVPEVGDLLYVRRTYGPTHCPQHRLGHVTAIEVLDERTVSVTVEGGGTYEVHTPDGWTAQPAPVLDPDGAPLDPGVERLNELAALVASPEVQAVLDASSRGDDDDEATHDVAVHFAASGFDGPYAGTYTTGDETSIRLRDFTAEQLAAVRDAIDAVLNPPRITFKVRTRTKSGVVADFITATDAGDAVRQARALHGDAQYISTAGVSLAR